MANQSGPRQQIFLSFLVGVSVLATACSSAKKKEEADASANAPVVAAAPVLDENASNDSDSGKAMGLQTVFFLYDSFVLDDAAKAALEANANLLKSNPGLHVQIEGHCDQRGGIQYNIALGEKRANSTRKYLQDLGVDGSRLTVISFGKEKPLDSGTTEAAYSKNRRANFAITAK